MPTVDVLATVKWNTLIYMYKRSLIKLFFKGYHGMLPSTLADDLIIHGNRPSSPTTEAWADSTEFCLQIRP